MLTFEQLREANDARAKEWGPEAPLSFNLIELAGETGEACNVGKKIARREYGLVGGLDEAHGIDALLDELADVVICTDLVARKLGFALDQAIVKKFNQTSEKHGFKTRLKEDSSHDYRTDLRI
jgi:NTP pyrophosphatase (non-canonical NTP hydrolase)